MYRALLICNSRFPESAGEIAELHGSKKDGMLLRDALTDHDTGMFNKSDVHLMPEGSSAEIISEIEKFFTSAESDDTLLFYYSGHGKVLNQQFFLAAHVRFREAVLATCDHKFGPLSGTAFRRAGHQRVHRGPGPPAAASAVPCRPRLLPGARRDRHISAN